MRLLGVKDEAARQHELAELGEARARSGVLHSMCEASDLNSLCRFYEAAVTSLEERVAAASPEDPQLAYLRSLIILAKKVELDLSNQLEALTRLFHDLEQMHDFVHEIYPVD